jgi:hypothetical protein
VAEDLRWNLVQTRLAQANHVTVSEEEIHQAAKRAMQQQFYQYGMYDLDDAKLENITARYLGRTQQLRTYASQPGGSESI